MSTEQTILDIEISKGKPIDKEQLGKSTLEEDPLDYYEGEGDR